MKPVDRVRSDRRLHALRKRVARLYNHIGVHTTYRHQLLRLMVRLSIELDSEGWWAAMLTSSNQVDVNKYTVVINKATLLRDWIYNNFPKSGDAWAVYAYDTNGTPIRVALTTAQENAVKQYLADLLGVS